MIVTIDGPSGSGKSTAARVLAERLGFEYLDTGAMFRAVAFHLIRHNIPTDRLDQVGQALSGVVLEVCPGAVRVNSEDVTRFLRTPEVTAASSRIAVIPAVREFLAVEQRRYAAGRDIICEGRDQGTAVFPDAECKFFLTADPRVRAERRHREMALRGDRVPLDAVEKQQQERDQRDSSREIAPLQPANDAIMIDTSDLTLEEMLDCLEREILRCLAG